MPATVIKSIKPIGTSKPDFETLLHHWLEPFIVFITAPSLRANYTEQRLSFWLLLVAAAPRNRGSRNSSTDIA